MKTSQNKKNAQTTASGAQATAGGAQTAASRGNPGARLHSEPLNATGREIEIAWDVDRDPRCVCDICAEARGSKRVDSVKPVQQQALRILASAIIAEELLSAIGNGADPLECIELARDRVRGIQAAASAMLDQEVVRSLRTNVPSHD